VQHSRFVFIGGLVPPPEAGDLAEGIVWILVSPNNRPLGLGMKYHEAYVDCRESVVVLKANHTRLNPVESTVELTGQWTWRVELDGVDVAKSSRSYLRARECQYNLQRFLEAVPNAAIVAGARSARRGRPAAVAAEPPLRHQVLGSVPPVQSVQSNHQPSLRARGEMRDCR
jgi:hypothetical protein